MSTSPQDFNANVIEEFRANQGHVGGMFEHMPLVLLHHTGAKSGTPRVNPPRHDLERLVADGLAIASAVGREEAPRDGVRPPGVEAAGR